MHRLWATVLLGFALVLAPDAFARGHDFDGDGRDDVFWRNADTGANALWLSANASTQQPTAAVGNLRWAVVGAGDFDRDGRADLLWRQRSSGANTIWLSGNASTQRAVARVSDVEWQVAGVGDFDRDGRDDVLWRHQRSGSNQVWPAADWTRALYTSMRPDYVVAGISDFDGDGWADILWRNRGGFTNVVWPAATPGRARQLADNGSEDWWFQIEAIGDFDADGQDDILWRQLNDGRNVVWPSADASRSRSLATVLSPSWQVAGTGDYDGDGTDDLFWRNDDDGRNALWRGAEWNGATRPAAVGNPAWSLAPFDAEPAMPRILISRPKPVMEGNGGSTQASVRVRLSHPSAVPVRLLVDAGPTQVFGAVKGEDFLWPDENLEPEFAPGETTLDLSIPVLGDTKAEANEPIGLWLVTVDDAYVLGYDGTLTIINDDANALWIESGGLVSDEVVGTAPMHFVIRLSRAQSTDVTLTASTTTGGNATPGVDYVEKSARLTIPAGATEVVFTVDVIGDTFGDAWGFGESVHVIVSQVSGAVTVQERNSGRIIDWTYRRMEP